MKEIHEIQEEGTPRRRRIENIVQAARELDVAERTGFLDEICDDESLRREVEARLDGAETPPTVRPDGAAGGSDAGREDLTLLAPRSAPVEAVQTFIPGTLIAGRFRVLRFLAAGGMGEVYELEDLELDEKVAAKTVRPQLARDPLIMERFRREVQLARQVTHPSVCRCYDIFRHETIDGRTVHFLTMELLTGETLKQRIRRRGAMKAAEALPIARQIAAALTAAHTAGVVHRDLKSSNVVLEPTEGGLRAVVTDFGLACLERPASAPASASVPADGSSVSGRTDGGLTAFGAFLGTPAYMAPEQIGGGEITPAADVYAFGVVLYEMVTGRLPFRDDATPFDRLSAPPPLPREHVPDLPARWARTIQHCLEPRVPKRLQSAEAVVAGLTRRHPAWRVLAAALAAAALAAGLYSALDLPPPAVERPRDAEAQRLYREGLDKLRGLDAPAARRLFEHAAAVEDDAPLVHRGLADALALQGRAAEACDEATEARRRGLDGRTPDPERLLVEAAYHELCRPRGAASLTIAAGHYRRLVDETEAPVPVALRLAAVLREAGRPAAALSIVEGLRARVPAPGDATVSLAVDLALHLAEAHAAAALGEAERLRSAADLAVRRAQATGGDRLLAGVHLELGEAWLAARNYAAADESAKAAQRLLPAGDDSAAMAGLLAIRAERRMGDRLTAERIEEVVSAFQRLHHRHGQAQALYIQGMYLEDRDARRAQEIYEDVVRLSDGPESRGHRLLVLYRLAFLHQQRDRLDAAETRYEQALELARELGDGSMETLCLNSLGTVFHRRGDLAAAQEHYELSLDVLRREDAAGHAIDRAVLARRLNNLGNLYSLQGDLTRARHRYEEALEVQHETPAVRAFSLSGLGWILLAQDDLPAARARMEEALATRLTDDPERAAASRLALARLTLEEGRMAEAEALARQAVEDFAAAGRVDYELEGRVLFAEVLIRRGRLGEAREPLAWAGGLAARSDDLRRQLRLRAFTAWLEGREANARGKPVDVPLAKLDTVARTAREEDLVEIDLETRLLAGKVALAAGLQRGRSSLLELVEDAEARGFLLIARQARRALG